MSWCIHQHSGGTLPAPTEMPYFEGILGNMLEGEREDLVLVIDEANQFTRLPTEFKTSFIDNVRFLKQSSTSRLLSVVMVGTDSLLADLKVANKYLRRCATPGDNVFSPFSNDALFTSKNFTKDEVYELVTSYSEFTGVEVDDRIPESIFELTRGYKGLVGVCCSLLAYDRTMSDSPRRSYSVWQHFVKSSLVPNVFARPTYNNIWENCHALGDKEWILLEMLSKGGSMHVRLSDASIAATVHFMVAEGIAVDTSDSSLLAVLSFSSPLLQSCLLRQISLQEDVNIPPGPMPFSRTWTLERTIELLNLEVLREPESLNADGGYTSEYGLQFEFYLKVKILSSAYSWLTWVIIPEAKCAENFTRRVDLLARDEDTERWFAFEFLRQGTLATLAEHYERALCYAHMHGCHVFMVNFVLEGPGVEYRGEEGAPVTVFNVVIDGSRARMVGSWFGDGGFRRQVVRHPWSGL